MARMSIDDSVQRDPRITKLAKIVGWSRRETLGALILDVWPICYDQRTHEIAADLIDVATDRSGFVDAMVEAGLARWLRGNRKVAINGAKERIEYLDHKKRAGSIGGTNSAISRIKKSSTAPRVLEQAGSTPQAAGNPLVPDSASVPDLVLVPVPETKRPAASAASTPPASEASGKSRHQPAVDAFHAYFKRTHEGSPPTWGKDRVGAIAGLVKKLGCDEVVRRIGVLEHAPPKFPPPPWDLFTFVQHVDKVASSTNRTQTGLDAVLAIARGEST